MKKYITFANFMVLLGIMTILFYLIPAIHIESFDSDVYSADINLFTATFGGNFTIPFVGTSNVYHLVACGGLVAAFFLGIVGIILTFLKCKIKIANLFAFPFYIAAGILVVCAATMVYNVNANGSVPATFSYSLIGGAITVGVFWFILGFFALIDFIASIAKPKQQNPAY